MWPTSERSGTRPTTDTLVDGPGSSWRDFVCRFSRRPVEFSARDALSPDVGGANGQVARIGELMTQQDQALEADRNRRGTYTVTEAAELIGISRSTAYECVKSGQVPSLRFRRRIVIPASAVRELLCNVNDHAVFE
jgi:excisionase family DNA binding protein